MRRFTDSDFILTVKGIDLTQANVYITVKQNGTCLTINADRIRTSYDGTSSILVFELTQEETSTFASGRQCEIQVNWVQDGERSATDISRVNVLENLLNEVIE